MVESKENHSVASEPKQITAEGASSISATKKGAGFKFGKREAIIVGIVVVLLVLAWLFVVFLPNQYRFSFNIDGLDYYSNEYTPAEFFGVVNDSNNFVVSVELVDGNADPFVVNTMNLWLIALNAKQKHTVSLVKTVDQLGAIKSCLTNDANVMMSRSLTAQECEFLLNDANAVHINLHKSTSNKVILYSKRAEIYSLSGKNMSNVSYAMIIQFYKDFDTLLQRVNEQINSVK